MSGTALVNALLALAGEGLAHANRKVDARDTRIRELEAENARLRADISKLAASHDTGGKE
jgi:outer membrane murein-binding lipoprotein Lpp